MNYETTIESIKKDLQENPILLYMKGTKEFPMCGFSAKVVGILKTLGIEFETRNVLEDEDLRATIKVFASWPTFPQLYVNSELVGGCDIVDQLYQTGELEKVLESAKV